MADDTTDDSVDPIFFFLLMHTYIADWFVWTVFVRCWKWTFYDSVVFLFV